MVNIVNKTIRDDQLRFIAEIAFLFAPWGMPASSGRVYGYILLKDKPVGLDQIAVDLQMSKVGAWKVARNLAEFGHVRRYGEPGSKRALYGPTDNFDVPFVKQCALLGALSRLLRDGALASKGDTAIRLKTMAKFYTSMRQAMTTAVEEMHSSREKVKQR